MVIIENISDIDYVMVSDLEGHWEETIYQDGIKINRPHFTETVIRDEIFESHLPKDAVTLFIKFGKASKEIEQTWFGKTSHFHRFEYDGRKAISFDVDDIEITECPIEFESYPMGWNLNKAVQFTMTELMPPFFKKLRYADWKRFEIGCYYLLRALGIHCIGTVPQDNNGGKEDGAFMIGDLAVLYDCTTEKEFVERKKRQIKNYIQELKTGEIEVGKKCFQLNSKYKQVWIITRNDNARHLDSDMFIQDGGEVKVKEVPYSALINIFQRRLDQGIDEAHLCKMLKEL